MSEGAERRCAFLPNRICYVEADEIPLEVCRLCLEAWKAGNERVTVRRSVGVEAPEMPSAFRKPTVQTQPLERAERETSVNSVKPEREQMLSLAELDRLFAEDKIGLNEYLEKRKRIVNSAKRGNSTFAVLEEMLKGSERKATGILIMDRGRVTAKHPEDWALPDGFDGRLLKTVYDLYMASSQLNADAHLQIGGARIIGLACRGKRLALLFLNSSLDFENFEDSVRKIRSELEMREDWNDVLPRLYDEYFHRVYVYV